jgi:hypothetical protein
LVKLVKILQNPSRYVRLSRAELSLYARDRRSLLERARREFPEMAIGDDGRSTISRGTRVRFLDDLDKALEKRFALPYRYVLEEMQFQFAEEDDDPEAAALAEARQVSKEAKARFLAEAEQVLGQRACQAIKVERAALDELDGDDATFLLTVSATQSEHKALLKAISGLTDPEIREALSVAPGKAHKAAQRAPASAVDDFVAYVIEEQHKLFLDSFQADPASFDDAEPQRMSRSEALDFAVRSLDEMNDDVLSMLKVFCETAHCDQDGLLEALRRRRHAK